MGTLPCPSSVGRVTSHAWPDQVPESVSLALIAGVKSVQPGAFVESCRTALVLYHWTRYETGLAPNELS